MADMNMSTAAQVIRNMKGQAGAPIDLGKLFTPNLFPAGAGPSGRTAALPQPGAAGAAAIHAAVPAGSIPIATGAGPGGGGAATDGGAAKPDTLRTVLTVAAVTAPAWLSLLFFRRRR